MVKSKTKLNPLNMKNFSIKFLLLLILVLTPSLAFAGRYSSLKFTSDSGETYSVTTDNLEILINGENLTFNNTNLTIPLSSLVSMEFTDYDDSPAAIETVTFDGRGAVTVYNINGVSIGSFDSYAEALASLSQGLYVIKDANGNSLKINVEK